MRSIEEEHANLSELKERTQLALEKLGGQKFSLDPGGYTFSNWMTSFNMLLDDFEEKVGAGQLSKDYYDSRQKLTADLLEPIDTAEFDIGIEKIGSGIKSTEFEIAKLTGELSSIRERERHTTARIDSLRRKRANSERELASAVKNLNEARKKQTVFNRLFSGKTSEIDSAKNRVDVIMEEQENIDKQVLESEKLLDTSDNDLENRLPLLKQQLADMRYSLAELTEKKETKLQLSEKRIETTSELSKKVASLEISMEKSSDTAQ